MGDWSQAGVMVTVTPNQYWFCLLPREEWPEGIEDNILKDFQEPHGDRRQEIVFIGFSVAEKEQELSRILDECLCTEQELRDIDNLSDPFEEWILDDHDHPVLQENAAMRPDMISEHSSIALLEEKELATNTQLFDGTKTSLICCDFFTDEDGVMEELAEFGDQACSSFYYIEDPSSHNDVCAQFASEFKADIMDTDPTLRDEGCAEIAEVLEKSIPTFQKVMQRMLQSFNKEIVQKLYAEPVLYYLQIEINIAGACIKLHNDEIGVRSVVALSGNGTVVAESGEVDWKKWRDCEGLFQASQAELDPMDYLQEIRDWNDEICEPSGQFALPPGSLLMMRGGAGGLAKPCIHRAPYSAGDPEESHRVLVKLDCLPKNIIQQLVDSRD